MPKKCKNCGTQVENEVKICPTCQNLAFDEPTRIELSNEQLRELATIVTEKLSGSPKVLFGVTWRVGLLIFALLGIPGAITGWNIWSAFDNFRTKTTSAIENNFKAVNEASSNQIAKDFLEITNDVNLKFQDFSTNASAQLASAYNNVTNQITFEFQTPRIKETVKDVAQSDAREILEQGVQPEIDKFRSEAELLRQAMRAHAYDYRAYKNLLSLETGTNDDAHFATEVINEIDRSLEQDRGYSSQISMRTYLEYVSTNNYSGPFTDDEIATRFAVVENDQDAFNREGFINTASTMSQPLFMSQLITFFTNEIDLTVADRLTAAISKLSGQDFHPHDYQRIITWWESNKNTFTNWPVADFWNAAALANDGKVQEASTLYEQILGVDPMADLSRACAIICDCEDGQTNKAWMLAKGFNNTNGRWAQWATAKMELQSGNSSNATVQLATLINKYPTFPMPPKLVPKLWNGIDWDLYSKLTENK